MISGNVDRTASGRWMPAHDRSKLLIERLEDLPDPALLRLAAGGDWAAFAALHARHASKVRGIALKIVRDDASAEDICQEAFLRLWMHCRNYRDERGSVGSWLYRIARNLALDEFRRRRSERAHSAPDGSADPLLSMVADREPGPEQTAQTRALQESLAIGLQGLPSPQAQVVTLAFIGGLTHREVAAALNQPLGTVKYRIARGLRSLRSDCNLVLAVGET
jgi:RNA polymerase sigma-70 factor (ECF subfamily)